MLEFTLEHPIEDSPSNFQISKMLYLFFPFHLLIFPTSHLPFALKYHSAVCFNPCANVKGGFQFSSFLIFDESSRQILPSQQEGSGGEAQIPARIFMIKHEILIHSFRHSGRPVAKTR